MFGPFYWQPWLSLTVHLDCRCTAIGVNEQGYRKVLGVSCALSEAEVHWRHFLESLLKRGLT